MKTSMFGLWCTKLKPGKVKVPGHSADDATPSWGQRNYIYLPHGLPGLKWMGSLLFFNILLRLCSTNKDKLWSFSYLFFKSAWTDWVIKIELIKD